MNEVKITGKGLYKIFGSDPQAALDALRDGRSRDELFDETGHVAAVRDASFDVCRGEIFVVMGLSGSGKSTLVRMINRLIEPTAGHILIDGRDITHVDDRELRRLRRRDAAMVFQSFALMPHLSNLQNAAFGLKIAGIEHHECAERARAALDTVGLGPYADSYPHELSGGMQQRVGLARALAVEPSILLMDEAFSALDPLIRVEMQDELLRIQRERELTVVFISHDLDEALHIGDRLAIMQDGAIVQTGTPQELINDPADEYIAAFFGKVDLSKVFTAGDLARFEPGTVVRLPMSVDSALSTLERDDHTHGYVVDRQGGLAGIVSLTSLRDAKRHRRSDVREALLQRPVTLAAEERIEACLGAVADARYAVPVMRGERFVGTIGWRRVLKTLERTSRAGVASPGNAGSAAPTPTQDS